MRVSSRLRAVQGFPRVVPYSVLERPCEPLRCARVKTRTCVPCVSPHHVWLTVLVYLWYMRLGSRLVMLSVMVRVQSVVNWSHGILGPILGRASDGPNICLDVLLVRFGDLLGGNGGPTSVFSSAFPKIEHCTSIYQWEATSAPKPSKHLDARLIWSPNHDLKYTFPFELPFKNGYNSIMAPLPSSSAHIFFI